MFVSHERSPSKKTFQKPNILRRKTKIPSLKALPLKPTLVSPLTVDGKPTEPACDETLESSHKLERRLQLDWRVTRGGATAAVADQSAFIDGVEHNKEQEPVNVEAFLNGSQSTQYETEYESKIKLENQSLQKWRIDFGNAAEKIVIAPFEGLQVFTEDGASPAARAQQPLAAGGGGGGGGDAHHVPIEHFTTRPAKFKCDEPDCNKQFLTEQKLRRHRSVHNKSRAPRATAVECPVRSGAEPCGRVFPARAALAAHLSEDHEPDDAPHRCGECGRRFFWAVGLRAHARAHRCARAALACAWPGCGRAFRQPCRLREHARAHTGDRPYPCRHPGCGWAFRTASKLRRHARRHSGERRHACACGRAFRRREHLRDHQARHRRAAPRARRACPHPGCAQSFGSASALSAHGRRAHGGEGPAAPADGDPGAFPVQLLEGGASGRSARTHLPWPLPPQPDCALEERELHAVRSDLFLPASAAVADDSQQLPSVSGSGAGSPAAASPPHAGLGLLDLMQEELMYADAVDESSFQVLLLSEELG